MPLHDYRCAQCGRRFTLFLRSFAETAEPRCERCGSTDAKRLPPRVSMLRSEESRLESLADPSSLGDVDENDPQSVARWAKKLAGTMGEDDLGDELEAAMEEPGPADDAGDAGDDGGVAS